MSSTNNIISKEAYAEIESLHTKGITAYGISLALKLDKSLVEEAVVVIQESRKL